MNSLISWQTVDLDHIQDERGSISIAEKGRQFDFDVRRIFFLSAISAGQERGHHAHQELQQIIFATSGSFTLELDDGKERTSFHLKSGGQGVFVNGPVWRVMKDFTPDAVMMVLCDRVYAEDKVIRSYDEFLRASTNGK
ncbi:FdtA/QdtA family cupin domain-containing protein [Pseudaeromonas paramecii]|uniref:Sugar 3,4-ketoisomerase QdtA cupin domain-containing protein n=1 Tax=Pseudaeromonas paramecii TaxID=2138166 RepID=A0ABP8Q556_9GAMM